jgi:hypothetical protein
MPLWMASCAAFSQAIIAHEIDFYTQYGQPAIAAWYRELAQMAVQALADGSVLMQFGWGTGWIAKTLGPDLLHPDRADDLAEVRETYWLGRKEVNLFPKSRRLVSRDGTLLPLGWVRLRTGSATPIVVPVAPATAAPAPIPALRVNDLVIGVVSRFAQRDEVETFIKLERGDEVRLQTREIAERPVAHPQDILRLKQKVRVRILRIRGNQIDVTMRGVSQEQLDGAQ